MLIIDLLSDYVKKTFWKRLDKSQGCWTWQGGHDKDGYGRLTFLDPNRKHRHHASHRIAWELVFGAIPDGMQVCHTCDNPPCCNPAHLFLGENQDNVDDKMSKGREARGEHHGKRRLTDELVKEIRGRYPNETMKQIANDLDLSVTAVRQAIRKITWTHVM